MTENNGWSKYEELVLVKLDEVQTGITDVKKELRDYMKYCNGQFREHAVKIESSKWWGVLSGGGIVTAFLFGLMIWKVLQ